MKQLTQTHIDVPGAVGVAVLCSLIPEGVHLLEFSRTPSSLDNALLNSPKDCRLQQCAHLN